MKQTLLWAIHVNGKDVYHVAADNVIVAINNVLNMLNDGQQKIFYPEHIAKTEFVRNIWV